MILYDKTAKEALRELKSSAGYGLDYEEVVRRREQYGMNELEDKKKKGLFSKFIAQFNDFMILILIAAAIISFAVSYIEGEADFIDSIIILMIVLLNAVLGVVQEAKAERSIEALKEMAKPSAKVLREGEVMIVAASALVPGDVILLEAGDIIPADARLLETHNLKVSESALTGESEPSLKDAGTTCKKGSALGDLTNMVFTSGTVNYGRGKALVTATGMDTEVGKIAFMIMSDESPETPLQNKLAETGKMLGVGALSICLFIFVIGVIRRADVFEMFMTSVSLAVAAIPEGLPAIVTIMLAIGVQRMARRNAIVRKLPAVETLGSANVICSDKTGTLTQNKMKVVEVADINGCLKNNIQEEAILSLGALCNNAYIKDSGKKIEITGDPSEVAIIIAAMGLNKNVLKQQLPRVDEIPFDSKRKLMTTIHSVKGTYWKVITKGAPDILLDRCSHYENNGQVYPMTEEIRRKIARINNNMAGKALRVLGVAYKDKDNLPHKVSHESTERDLVFKGLIGMIDPPRPEAKEAVSLCKRAGIKTVMVTGDHVVTAKAIAEKLGILGKGDKALTGVELEAMTQEDLSREINQYAVFARVTPEHKVRIVKAFQSRGAVVAMTGDGVNDAPALKAADIGCAMGISGTDVAKEAADMVLTDDNFATIVSAVRQGRGIYANIRKAVHFLLSSNIGEIITIFIGILFGWPAPLLAIQLLWVNLVTDSLPAIALGVDPPEEGIMHKKPYKSQGSLFSGGLAVTIGLEGIMIGMLALLAFGIGWIYYDYGLIPVYGRTMSFAVLSISQLVHAFNMRSDDSIFKHNLFDNKYLVWAFFIGIAMQVGVITIPALSIIFKVAPLNFKQWAIVFFLSFMPIALVELEKMLNLRKLSHGEKHTMFPQKY